MVPDCRRLRLSEIDQAPESPGVYAWYTQIEISTADIQDIISRIHQAKYISISNAMNEVDNLLHKYIFNHFQNVPYHVTISGLLKATYSGEIPHKISSSVSLIERIVDHPERFINIATMLRNMAPWFTSPLYIGMSANLRSRLMTHRKFIIELRDLRNPISNYDNAEAGFARQIVNRNFDPMSLFVYFSEVPVDLGDPKDVENLLNRINHPILGRN